MVQSADNTPTSKIVLDYSIVSVIIYREKIDQGHLRLSRPRQFDGEVRFSDFGDETIHFLFIPILYCKQADF